MSADVDLHHHGDAEVGPGLVDLAVNVRPGMPPRWLADLLRDGVADLAAYPDPRAAREAVARHHGREPDEVLLTAGAAEAFVLLARVLAPKRAVVVHPQFTEPEAALRAAGHAVTRVVLRPENGFRLGAGPDVRGPGDGPKPCAAPGVPEPGEAPDVPESRGTSGVPERPEAPDAPQDVPADADLVMIGNPTNPTSVLHPARTLAALAAANRTLVVDEAFMDCVPGETESLAGRRDRGLVVIRSLTKTWGLAGLRAGYVLAEPEMIERLRRAQPLWSVSALALVATEACVSPRALKEAHAWACDLAEERERLAGELTGSGLHVVPDARASFLCVRVPGGLAVRARLRELGFAVRRGDTFPGLGPDWLRVAIRDRVTDDAFLAALDKAVHEQESP